MRNNPSSVINFITGGARSGKSRYAQMQALALSANPVYIATAKRNDAGEAFSKRIERHVADRKSDWINIEEPLHISSLPLENKVVVIDCVTLWLTNFFSLYKYDEQESLKAIQREIDALQHISATFFIISNEIGMGIHAETETGRKFTDLQGWANQYIAARANTVTLMVSGIPLLLKNESC